MTYVAREVQRRADINAWMAKSDESKGTLAKLVYFRELRQTG